MRASPNAEARALCGTLPASRLLLFARRWQSEDTAARAPCQGWTPLCTGLPCPSGSQRYQFSLCQGACGTCGRAELPAWAGVMPAPSGWGGWAGSSRPGLGHRRCAVRHMRSDVCWSSSAFSPANQWNRRARSGAWPRCGTGGEAAVSPGEEGTATTCHAPAHTGLRCSSSQPGLAVSSSCSTVLGTGRWTPWQVSRWPFSPVMEQRRGCFMARAVAW